MQKDGCAATRGTKAVLQNRLAAVVSEAHFCSVTGNKEIATIYGIFHFPMYKVYGILHCVFL